MEATENDKINITLNISGVPLSIKVLRTQEAMYRLAGERLNQKINVYAKKYGKMEDKAIRTMVLIETMMEVQNLEADANTIKTHAQSMLNTITEVLKNS